MATTRRTKAKIKEIDIVASDGDRNIDMFMNEDKSRGRTEYFYHSRRKYSIGEQCIRKPEYYLIEIRKYVLGVIYIWQIKK